MFPQHSYAHRSRRWRKFLHWGSFFPDVSLTTKISWERLLCPSAPYHPFHVIPSPLYIYCSHLQWSYSLAFKESLFPFRSSIISDSSIFCLMISSSHFKALYPDKLHLQRRILCPLLLYLKVFRFQDSGDDVAITVSITFYGMDEEVPSCSWSGMSSNFLGLVLLW